MPSVIMTLVGPDRPGLVDKISDVIQQHEGNWLESRMARLAGQFAGVVRVDVSDKNEAALRSSLDSLSDQQLHVVTKLDASENRSVESTAITVHVVGNDRPGIVRRISAVLSSHEVNVEELSTECREAPHSGGALFEATARLQVPDGMPVEMLQDELERIAADLMIDISLDS